MKKNMTTTAREAKKDRVLGAGRIADLTLGWVARDYPNLSTWRDLAVEWLKMEPKGLNTRLRAFNNFFDRYLIQQQLPVEPERFLSRDIIVPDFYSTACPHSAAGVQNNNIIRTFLDWVLLRNFSVEMPNGQRLVLQGYDNPVPYRSHSGLPKLEESVHSPLPYPVGWMHMHHGLCMVGGNTSEIEGNAKIGGCYNGGPNIGSSSIPKYAPVPGGDRNCVQTARSP
jgi:hypothetical protein